jgi:hypothetical protein
VRCLDAGGPDHEEPADQGREDGGQAGDDGGSHFGLYDLDLEREPHFTPHR